MKKLILSMVLMLGMSSYSWAQTMTYNHDESKEEQIKVMELGSGALTPEWYYTITHNSYKKGAKSATSVKNTLRLAASTASLPQVE